MDEEAHRLAQAGLTLGPGAKVDEEATRDFVERFTEQARDNMGAGGDRGYRPSDDDEED